MAYISRKRSVKDITVYDVSEWNSDTNSFHKQRAANEPVINVRFR
jgi:hypothetical protein